MVTVLKVDPDLEIWNLSVKKMSFPIRKFIVPLIKYVVMCHQYLKGVRYYMIPREGNFLQLKDRCLRAS